MHSPAFSPALRITKQKLTDQRFLFLGGGSAATGIAELISEAMTLEGLDFKTGACAQRPLRHQRPCGAYAQ
ncbi:MAG: malic enzyme-like NAD(P)-binding protein [Methylovirgula sp.]